MTEFTHINKQGNAKMVDVSDKNTTKRSATAHSSITVNPAIYKQIVDHTNQKGNVLNTAQIAGIMAAKNTSDIIPMCHPLMITKCNIDYEIDEVESKIKILATVKLVGKTGVEMEALTAATITALKTFTKPIHLILGGLERNQDFNELNDYMQYVKRIYAIGGVTDRVADYAASLNIPCDKCYVLADAMKKIKEDVASREVVLLSP